MLKVRSLNTYYGNIHALKGIDFDVNEGEIVTLIGSNGAGKTTTLLSITGVLKVQNDSIIELNGASIVGYDPKKIVKMGVTLSPEGREIFPDVSVESNLYLGAYSLKNKNEINEQFHRVYDLFPRLLERKNQVAGTLSGGEQQMLAVGRALMSKPKLLMLDEPSLGLAPTLVKLIFKLIVEINQHGTTVLLVEQNASMALKIAHRCYVLETGRVKFSGLSDKIRDTPEVRRAYLGTV